MAPIIKPILVLMPPLVSVSLSQKRLLTARAAALPLCRRTYPQCPSSSNMNILNGGKHAEDGVDFQEFMVVPHGAILIR